ncbi:SH3 domain-containing protein [Streptomyces decoyicus]|uniref:SH3 domain-containing protein n=1 Tax=Streptomyces decoyicus TaxID=249567 RepID=UPI002E179756|nr:SH3 domain-containing protein [Streptomyces decoyicus]
MKKKCTALIVAAAAVMGTTLTSGVAAASTASTTQAAGLGTAAAWKVKAQATVTVRAKPKTKSAAVGTIPKGTVITIDDADDVAGSRYTACGITDKVWHRVKWHGAKGWVVDACWTAIF